MLYEGDIKELVVKRSFWFARNGIKGVLENLVAGYFDALILFQRQKISVRLCGIDFERLRSGAEWIR